MRVVQQAGPALEAHDLQHSEDTQEKVVEVLVAYINMIVQLRVASAIEGE